MTDSDLQSQTPAPISSPDLFGHEEAERTLNRAFNDGRLHHAWLISGPRGIGKATLAYRFARYVLAGPPAGGGLFGADLPPGGDRDDLFVAPEHPVFKRVVAGGHSDLLAITKSENDRGVLRSEIVVDDVRRTRNFFHMTAGEGGWRVIVVDSADDMNANAANALLKMLEEPPPNALLLLVSHNPGNLLPTIRSRCRKLRLEALTPELVAERLAIAFPELDAAETETVSILAGGSLGRAYELAEAGGIEIFSEVMTLLEGGGRPDIPKLHDFASKCSGKNGSQAFALAGDFMRDELARLVKHMAGDRTQPITRRQRALFERLGPAAGLDQWLGVWEKVDDSLTHADRANLDRKQVILNVFSLVAETAAGGPARA